MNNFVMCLVINSVSIKSYIVMKRFLILIVLFCSVVLVNGQAINPAYDSTLARKLGGDDYGMKMYVLVILKTGTFNEPDKAKRDTLFAGHMRNIRRLAGLKKLIVAGPLAENENAYRGIFILDVRTPEEAAILLESDPTVKSKIFDPIYLKWYGSAALSEYLGAHDKIWKINP
jgi:uncharacterized protein YciI